MEKRVKNFTKNLTMYKSNPFYEDIKQLYKNDIIKTLDSAENALMKIKVTKAGTIDKRSNKQVEKINKLIDKFKQIQEEKTKAAVLKRKVKILKKREFKQKKIEMAKLKRLETEKRFHIMCKIH